MIVTDGGVCDDDGIDASVKTGNICDFTIWLTYFVWLTGVKCAPRNTSILLSTVLLLSTNSCTFCSNKYISWCKKSWFFGFQGKYLRYCYKWLTSSAIKSDGTCAATSNDVLLATWAYLVTAQSHINHWCWQYRNWRPTSKPVQVHSFTCASGVNTTCLPAAGIYQG